MYIYISYGIKPPNIINYQPMPNTFTVVDPMPPPNYSTIPMLTSDSSVFRTNMSAPMGMMVTIQSDSSMSPAIEFTTNMMSPTTMANNMSSGNLLAHTKKTNNRPVDWAQQQQYSRFQQQAEPFEQLVAEPYYYPSRPTKASPPASPARLYRNGQTTLPRAEVTGKSTSTSTTNEPKHLLKVYNKVQHTRQPSSMISKQKWRPSYEPLNPEPAKLVTNQPATSAEPLNFQHSQQSVEKEEIISVGPASFIPIYQSLENGQLHTSIPSTVSPGLLHMSASQPNLLDGSRAARPDNDKSFESGEIMSSPNANLSDNDANGEVRLVGQQDRAMSTTETSVGSSSEQARDGARSSPPSPPTAPSSARQLQGRTKSFLSAGH